MEFHIETRGLTPNLDAINEAIGAVDPGVMADLDTSGATLRVAAAVESAELMMLLAQAGFPVVARQVRQLPSMCCGGCGG